MGLFVAGLVADEAEAALRGPRGPAGVERELFDRKGRSTSRSGRGAARRVPRVHAARRAGPRHERDGPRVAVGVRPAHRGRRRQAAPQILQSRVPVPAILPGEAQGPEAAQLHPPRAPRERVDQIRSGRAARPRPRRRSYFVEWRDVIQPEINRDDLDAMFANLTDADLVVRPAHEEHGPDVRGADGQRRARPGLYRARGGPRSLVPGQPAGRHRARPRIARRDAVVIGPDLDVSKANPSTEDNVACAGRARGPGLPRLALGVVRREAVQKGARSPVPRRKSAMNLAGKCV